MKIRVLKKSDNPKPAPVVKAPKASVEAVVKNWIDERTVNRMQEQLDARKFWGLK